MVGKVREGDLHSVGENLVSEVYKKVSELFFNFFREVTSSRKAFVPSLVGVSAVLLLGRHGPNVVILPAKKNDVFPLNSRQL